MSTLAQQHNTQGFGLGGQSTRGIVGSVINCTAQTDILLQDLVVASSNPFGVITDIRCAGQSLIVGTGALDLQSFQPGGCPGDDGARSIGVALEQNQVLSVSTTLDIAATCAVYAGCDPVSPDQIVPINESDLSYAAGLGSTICAGGGATTTITTTINRSTVLGRLCMSASDGAGAPFALLGDLTVSSIAVNNVELMSSSAGAAGEIPLQALLAASTMTEELILGFYCPPNSTVSISIVNYNVAAGTVRGTIFCLPTS